MDERLIYIAGEFNQERGINYSGEHHAGFNQSVGLAPSLRCPPGVKFYQFVGGSSLTQAISGFTSFSCDLCNTSIQADLMQDLQWPWCLAPVLSLTQLWAKSDPSYLPIQTVSKMDELVAG
jgi:hypothetical protein